MKCQACSQEVMLPFHCPFCGGHFCDIHRLPENHACPRMDFAKTQRQEQVMTNQSHGSYSYSYVYGQDPNKRKRHITTSPKELKHIGVAATLVLGIGFSIGIWGNMMGSFPVQWTWPMMTVFGVVMIASFLTHEVGHKIMAQRRGLWAEFRLTTWGALLTLASVFLPVRMIAPGAMMISGNLQERDDLVKISIAGPITNLIYGGVFLGLAFMLPFTQASIGWGYVLLFSAYINAFMALFNLIPFGVLDGFKIFNLDKKLWIAVFIPAVFLTIVTFLFV